ncbi:MAG: exonuclease domain-containing protein [Actinomycetales bacterium]
MVVLFTHGGPLGVPVATAFPLDYAVVDCETTGLVPGRDRVVQVAIRRMTADGTVTDRWSTLVDPQCHPGPVEIHGITPDRLVGAPTFVDVAQQIGELLSDRVLVAHNARFDFEMLEAEFDRLGQRVPVNNRLCTRDLARRLDLPLEDYGLATVAGFFGVAQWRYHDAEGDADALVEVLRHLLSDSYTFAITLPLATCALAGRPRHTRRSQVSPYANPGRWRSGTNLVQGMAFVVTGETELPRHTILDRGYAAGLSAMNSVSGRTSLLVSNDPDSGSGKLRAADKHGTPVVDEEEFLALLGSILPGTRQEQSSTGPAVAAKPVARRTGPMAGRRVLVLGGLHGEAAQVRERIGERGGAPRVMLTQTVTDVVALHGADRDARWPRVLEAGLTWLDPTTLESLAAPAGAVAAVLGSAVADHTTLVRGQVVDLPEEVASWQLVTSWLQSQQTAQRDVDVVAFRCGSDEKVRVDEDFVFYNQPGTDDGALFLDSSTQAEAMLSIEMDCLDDTDDRLLVWACLPDGHTFADVGAVELSVSDAAGAIFARATLDAATTEQSLHLATIYRRGGRWRLRVVGQGHEMGLAGLARLHGVDVDDPA